MAFDKKIKIDALTSAARHCCVCHRYKGVKVEVHHILPVAKGGKDEAENAIALCFDCHSDAGHYNDKHPRGIKFSPEELRQARNTWHLTVKTNKITFTDDLNYVYARYLVCKSFSAIKEICEGNLENFPVDSPLLFQNDIGKFQKIIVDSYPEGYRHSHILGETFKTRKDYSKKHPDVCLLDRSSRNHFPYFEAHRLPTLQELHQNVANIDFVTGLLLDEGISTEKISSVFAYDEFCGDTRFQEIYRLRPIWAVYLALSNISNNPITFKSLLCMHDGNTGVNFRSFFDNIESSSQEIKLPRPSIPPKSTVIIPVITLLGPIEGESPNFFWEDMSNISTGEIQTIAHGEWSNIIKDIAMIGPNLWPKALLLEVSSPHVAEHQIHEFDISNLYSIDRFWQCGSCPHLFLETFQGKKYWGELFAKAPKEMQTTEIRIPEGVYGCILVELEDEVTHLSEILVNNITIYSNVTLNKNEQLFIPVNAGDQLYLSGLYEPLPHLKDLSLNPWRKNEIILEYMRNST